LVNLSPGNAPGTRTGNERHFARTYRILLNKAAVIPNSPAQGERGILRDPDVPKASSGQLRQPALKLLLVLHTHVLNAQASQGPSPARISGQVRDDTQIAGDITKTTCWRSSPTSLNPEETEVTPRARSRFAVMSQTAAFDRRTGECFRGPA
jgi:hypothetical protein